MTPGESLRSAWPSGLAVWDVNEAPLLGQWSQAFFEVSAFLLTALTLW